MVLTQSAFAPKVVPEPPDASQATKAIPGTDTLLQCTPWALIGVRGVVGPKVAGAVPGTLQEFAFGGVPDIKDKSVHFLRSAAIPQIRDTLREAEGPATLGGSGNLSIGWVDYNPSKFAKAFLDDKVLDLVDQAEGGAEPKEYLPADIVTTEKEGAAAAAAQIAAQARECPNQRFILAGYSEGAWVLGDALQYAAIQGAEPALKPYYGRIDEVLLFGDPMFDSRHDAARRPAGQSEGPKAVGIAAYVLGPRKDYVPPELKDRVQSYCWGSPGTVDPVCAAPVNTKRKTPGVTPKEWARAMRNCAVRREFTYLVSANEIEPGPAFTANAECGHTKYTGGYSSTYSATKLHERLGATTTISSTHGWQSTGLHLTEGQKATITYVSGNWTVDTDLAPDLGRIGPQGYNHDAESVILPGCKLVGSAPYGSLVGAVGSSPSSTGTPSPVTFHEQDGRLEDGVFEAHSSGELFLRINDQDRCLGDNDGEVSVKVTITGS
ncbi:cutinase family protein [Streptomyces sp. NPDC006265]|uniref:cutinase family protein n=1 Tax=Streptomyces sp. NPDC006265 TaxID=3156740 RepID=UPI0033AC6B43